MSYLPPPPPPPPPNGAPYAAPPPQYGQPYPPQPGYGQRSLPPPPAHQHGHRPPPPSNIHQHTGHDRQQKPKMVVTRYGRPPNRQQNSWPPPPAQAALPPPPAAPYMQPSTWAQPPPPQGVAPAPYPPPPTGYSHAPPLPNQYPARFSGNAPLPAPVYPPPPNQQQMYPPPPAQVYPPPPAQSVAHNPPPPGNAPGPQWSAPPLYPPQVAYSPVLTQAPYQAPPAPRTPAQIVKSDRDPQPTLGPPGIVKHGDDPTFYEGWDEGEFEYAMALWIPPKGDTSHDTWSLGQYIWRGAQQITCAVSNKLDDPVEAATIEQKYDPNHFVVPSKYYNTEDAEGHEYVFNFQRIRHVDDWKEKKNDPFYKVFTHAELHEDVVPADEVFHQCLRRPREDAVDMAAFLETSLTGYFNGSKGGSGKNLEAENLLASLGVSGTAKPVFATPFPAYAPPPGESPAPRSSAPVTKQKPLTPRNNRFNPFKVASDALQHPTSHSRGLSSQRSGSALPSHRSRFSPSTTQTLHVSPARHSPSYLPSPSAQTGASRTISMDSRTDSPLPPPPPPPPPPPMQTGQQPQSHPQHSPARDLHSHDSRHRPHATPRELDMHSPQDPMYTDPWRRDNNGHRENMIASGPGIPAGPDVGGTPTNAVGPDSARDMPQDYYEPSNKKRRTDDPDDRQRKRNKPKPPTDSAYARRW